MTLVKICTIKQQLSKISPYIALTLMATSLVTSCSENDHYVIILLEAQDIQNIDQQEGRRSS